MSWLTTTAAYAFESFSMELLSSLLINGCVRTATRKLLTFRRPLLNNSTKNNSNNAPMYIALIESGLANTFAIAGYDDHYHREAPFSIGVSGIDSSQVRGSIETLQYESIL